MKKFLSGLGILSLVLMLAAPVLAAETVSATVTPQVIAVSVTDGTVDYGILAITESNNTIDGATGSVQPAAEQQTITNDSNVSANILLRSTDAVGSSVNWNLEATADTDQFIHSYDIDASGSAVWTVFPVDNSNSASVVTLVNKDDIATLDLKINMPTSVTDTSVHSTTVTAVAIETP